jgi:hypothetical protein
MRLACDTFLLTSEPLIIHSSWWGRHERGQVFFHRGRSAVVSRSLHSRNARLWLLKKS